MKRKSLKELKQLILQDIKSEEYFMIIDTKSRKIIKRYLILIQEHLEQIEGLEDYNIDNDELDEHYLDILCFIKDCYKELKEKWKT